jgi:hypothetical protein
LLPPSLPFFLWYWSLKSGLARQALYHLTHTPSPFLH